MVHLKSHTAEEGTDWVVASQSSPFPLEEHCTKEVVTVPGLGKEAHSSVTSKLGGIEAVDSLVGNPSSWGTEASGMEVAASAEVGVIGSIVATVPVHSSYPHTIYTNFVYI